jgi:GT2 family glycosyltransferase
MSNLSVVIPTYQRGAAVVASVGALLDLAVPPDEILIVDQTDAHPREVAEALRELEQAQNIRWLRLAEPSIPHAMNIGLQNASHEIVLFLDDDIVPGTGLAQFHRDAQLQADLVAGMVLQPGEQAVRLGSGDSFRFASDQPARIEEFMGGNFSVKRSTALKLGGFDENFIGAAYRFEAEFAYRYVAHYGQIQYEPRAVIRHLQIASGGTRAHGHHLRTLRPAHSVGAYYELLRTRRPSWLRQILWRPLRAVRTRHHLRRPWWVPVTLLAEFRGLLLALRLHRGGAKLLDPSSQCE